MSNNASIRIALGQLRHLDEETLTFAQQLGVTSIQMFPDPTRPEMSWQYEHLKELKESCDAHGLCLESVASHIYTGIMLGLPNRDEEMDLCRETIRNMGKAGIPILGYDFMPNSVWRTTATHPGRGGAEATAFDMEIVKQTPPHDHRKFSLNPAPYIDDTFRRAAEHTFTADEMWANYEYFLRGVLPTAEEAGVRLAIHPDDPPIETLGGVARIFHNVDGFKRAMELANSDAWGVLLCMGSCAEMEGGSQNVREMIEYFGPRGKICYVHFRDVQGSVPTFAECFLGEGSFNPSEMMRLLIESGFSGFLMDDHVPHMVGDTPYGNRARAHAVGYMQGVLSALGEDSRSA